MKPILFNTEMVRAIRAGHKTVTRRVVKEPYYIDDAEASRVSGLAIHRGINMTDGMPYPDQLYRPGEVLYVRETWAVVVGQYGNWGNCKFAYKADNNWSVPRWRPSIHMPRGAARIFLWVKNVRVERLQGITEEQARAEGAIDNRHFIHSPDNEYETLHSAREHFAAIWDSTIKPAARDLYGWDANPWVWVIEFEQIGREEAEL